MNEVLEINSVNIKDMIYTIRGKQVMLDSDLAILYGVTTGRLNEQVKRNINRFPDIFMFRLTDEEYKFLISQFAISNKRDGRGGRRKLPYAFTEQGIAMLSAVLRSEVAVKVSVNIMNAFVEMRKFLIDNREIFSRLDKLEFNQLDAKYRLDDVDQKIIANIIDRIENID